MNKRELENQRKENSYKVNKFRLAHSFNCCKINTGNTLEHEISKLTTAYNLIKEGHIIATEVFSASNDRKYDIFDFDSGIVFEQVLTSEPPLKAGEKRITTIL